METLTLLLSSSLHSHCSPDHLTYLFLPGLQSPHGRTYHEEEPLNSTDPKSYSGLRSTELVPYPDRGAGTLLSETPRRVL